MLLAHELVKKGVPRKKITFALCRVGESEAEIQEARDYLTQAGYAVLAGTGIDKLTRESYVDGIASGGWPSAIRRREPSWCSVSLGSRRGTVAAAPLGSGRR